MDLPSTSHSNKLNIPRGCLTFNNKIYPVYEGHNTVGRNPGAVINIKNVSISQQHAVITVVDDDTHYISDFKSSNGTMVNNIKLYPLKLYPLENGAFIKFADIFCTYKKLNINESLLDTTDTNTQQDLSQNFYSSNTQTINSDEISTEILSKSLGINEMATQVINPLDIHEMPTQAMKSPKLSIHEMQTQVMDSPKLSIHEMQTQTATYIQETNESSNDSVDFMTMQKTSEIDNKDPCITPSQESDIVPVKINSSRRLLSGSETSTPELIKNKRESDAEEPPISQICPVKTGSRSQVIESDSDSEEIAPSTSKNKRRSRYVISDDDDVTDIEDDIGGGGEMIPLPKNSDSSFTESFHLKLEQKESEEKKIANLPIPEDHLYCRALDDDKEKIGEESNTKDEGSSSFTKKEDEEKGSSSNKPESVENQKEETGHGEVQNDEETENLIEDLSSSTKENDEKELSTVSLKNPENSEDQNEETGDEKKINDNLNNEKTQDVLEDLSSLTNENDEKGLSSVPAKNSESNEDQKGEENVNDEETQDLAEDLSSSFTREDNGKDLSLKNPEKREGQKGEIGDNERAMDVTTESQNIQNNKKLDGLNNEETPDLIEDQEKKKNEESNNNEEADVFDQATQQLDMDFVNEKTTKSGEEKENNEEKKDNFVFAKPTQPLISDLEKDKDDDDIYLQPTQELQNSENLPTNSSFVHDDSDIYIQPTQEISKNSKTLEENIPEDNEEIEEHDFLPPLLPILRPSTSKSVLTPVPPPSEEIEDDDDALFLPPTQALEMLHQGIPDDEEVKCQPEKVEDQLEMLFASQSDHRFVATQQLVDVLEEKNECDDDIIEDSMIEGATTSFASTSTSKWSKKIEFNSVEAIREILAESMLEEKEKLRKKEEEKEEIKNKGEKKKSQNEENKEEEKEEIKGRGLRKGRNGGSQNSQDSILSTKKKKKTQYEDEKIEETDLKKNDEKEETKGRGKRKEQNGGSHSSTSNDSVSSAKKKKTLHNEEETTEIQDDRKNEGRGKRRGKNLEVPQSTTRLNRGSQSSVTSSGSNDSISSTIKKKKKTVRNEEEDVNKEEENEEIKSKGKKKGKKSENISDNSSNTESQGSSTSTTKKKTKEETEKGKVNEAMDTRKTRSNANLKDKEEKEESINERKTKTKKEQNTRTTRSTKAQSKEIQEDKDSEDEEERNNLITMTPTTSNDNNSRRRKRVDSSEDEFMPKVQKTVASSPKKQKNKKEEEGTPPTRRSTRSTKNNPDQEIISIPSSSSSTIIDEVISLPSSSSTPTSASSVIAPTKRGRKLSANSRAMKNAEANHSKKIAQELSPILETPERGKRQVKPKVVFTMMDNPELESVIRQLGGSVVDTVDLATVLVTESVKRSQKLLRAVGQGKPICSPQWLKECKKNFKFLDPWDYILIDKEAEKKWDFSLRESLERSKREKLLENYTFQIMVTTAADVLKGAVEACGGKCVTRNLTKAGTDNLVIIANADQRNKFSKIVKDNPEVKVVEPEAIFDGTLRQEFRFQRHLLT